MDLRGFLVESLDELGICKQPILTPRPQKKRLPYDQSREIFPQKPRKKHHDFMIST